MSHHCHALARPCPSRMLMRGACWRRVPRDLQAEVYRTVGLRGPSCDATWAPWWRAQARAIAHVAFLVDPRADRRDAYLRRELAIADGIAGGRVMSHAYALSREPPARLLVALHDHDAVDRACEADLRALGFDGLTAAARDEIRTRHACSMWVTLRVIVGAVSGSSTAGAREVPEWIESHDDVASHVHGTADHAGEILGALSLSMPRLRRAYHRHVNDEATDVDERLAAEAVARATRWLRRREDGRRCR